ncbi:hypothetical protein [Methylobacterium sp. C1]|uniref:hypothetical protein n=1 Tax=Methylobacterium sp. C1 TaxID=1479019 RepID=UPI0008D980B8|nr:hypothetical protein [Methylobacterium sp. C1]
MTIALERKFGTLSKVAEPETDAFLGKLSQASTHLALSHAAAPLGGIEPRDALRGADMREILIAGADAVSHAR